MLNQVILVGRLVRDPDLSYLGTGTARARFTLAIDRRYKDEKGEVPTDFIECVLWGKTAENFAQYLCKGALTGVIGEIQTNKREKDGVMRYYTSVHCKNFHFIEPRAVTQERMEKRGMVKITKGEAPMEIVADDLPF